MKLEKKYLITYGVITLAILLVVIKYWDYVVNPWTRDGQLRADVIQVTPRVTGPIVELPIRDNQFVRAGDLLFRIDPRTFIASVEEARARTEGTGDTVNALEKQVEAAEAAVNVARGNIDRAKSVIAGHEATVARDKAELQRQKDLLPKRATSLRMLESAQANYNVSVQQKRSAQAQLQQAVDSLVESEAALAEAQAKLGQLGDDNPQLKAAIAALRQAELNLEFTEVRAPTDGYVTNLNLRLGTQAVANKAALALVDVSSFRVDGFFRENSIANIAEGDQVVVTLMTYPDKPLNGVVDSVGWGIARSDGMASTDLLPSISPTFDWIRLAQRVPVRINLTGVPEGVQLRVGLTGSVMVRTGTAGKSDVGGATPAPALLQ